MWTDRLRRVTRAALAAAEYTANVVYSLFDPRLRTSGAAPAESAARLPGDNLVLWASHQDTRAVTIEATPSEVWPWIAQAGYGRGGWYGDLPWWRDATGRRGPGSSSNHVVPELQDIRPGQVLLDGPGCDETTGAWRVRAVEPGRSLVLYSSRTFSGREVDLDSVPAPRLYFDCAWIFVLRPVPQGTRLLVRTRARLYPDLRLVRWLAQGFVWGDRAMQRAMLLGIKRRAESAVSAPSPKRQPGRPSSGERRPR